IVFRLDGAGERDGRAVERRAVRRIEGKPAQVSAESELALAVKDDFDDVVAGSDGNAISRDGGELLEIAGVGDGDRTGDVLPVHVDVEGAAGAVIGDEGGEVERAARAEIAGVAQ